MPQVDYMVSFMRSGLDLNRDPQMPIAFGLFDQPNDIRSITGRRNDKQERKAKDSLGKLRTRFEVSLTSAKSHDLIRESQTDKRLVNHD